MKRATDVNWKPTPPPTPSGSEEESDYEEYLSDVDEEVLDEIPEEFEDMPDPTNIMGEDFCNTSLGWSITQEPVPEIEERLLPVPVTMRDSDMIVARLEKTNYGSETIIPGMHFWPYGDFMADRTGKWTGYGNWASVQEIRIMRPVAYALTDGGDKHNYIVIVYKRVKQPYFTTDGQALKQTWTKIKTLADFGEKWCKSNVTNKSG